MGPPHKQYVQLYRCVHTQAHRHNSARILVGSQTSKRSSMVSWKVYETQAIILSPKLYHLLWYSTYLEQKKTKTKKICSLMELSVFL